MEIDFWGPRIGLTLVLFSAEAFTLFTAFLWWKGWRVLSWPRKPGTIKQIEVKRLKDSENTPYYQVDVLYEFEVNGQKIIGSNWYLNSHKTFAREEKANKFIDGNPKGARIIRRKDAPKNAEH